MGFLLMFGRAAMAVGGYEIARLVSQLFGRSHPAAPPGSSTGLRVSWPMVAVFAGGVYILWRHQSGSYRGRGR